MRYGLKLGRLLGVTIRLHASLLIIFALITASLAVSVFPAWHPTWDPGVTWGAAFMTGVLFLASILVHELAHAIAGRAQEIPFKGITLFLFGGLAHMEGEPPNPKAELWMALAGPAASAALGFGCLIGAALASAPDAAALADPEAMVASMSPLATVLTWLGSINLALAAFNMLPGFPLDGGRVLRAALWGWLDDLKEATRWATAAGRAVAWLFILGGLAMVFGVTLPLLGSGMLGGVWLIFIGCFLDRAALASYQQLQLRDLLRDLPVSQLMRRDIHQVTPEITVEQLVDRYLMVYASRAFPVVQHRQLVGLVCLEDVRALPREAWSDTTVGDIMTPADELETTTPSAEVTGALKTLMRHDVSQMPVERDGKLEGMLRHRDIVRWLELRSDLQAA